MNRAKRLSILLAVLVVACAATFLVLRMEQQQEQIQTSGETVFSLEPSSVQTLSWTYEDQTLAFHKDECWYYDEDEAFPVDEEKITQLLEQFQDFSAAFIITDVEDYGQYGLEDPTCTINLSDGETSYEILLGDYSTMDSQRYVSTGDGNVYLAVTDPLDAYDVELRDLILNDEIPALDQVSQIAFSGATDYTITYQEDSTATYSEDDLYFTQMDGADQPLDTSRVEGYLSDLEGLDQSTYVTYNVTDQDLENHGLNDPELTIAVDYTAQSEDGNEESGTFLLHISRDPEELAAQADSDSTETEEDPDEITAYARIGESQIVYRLTGEDYQTLMAATYDDLRHQQVLWADFSQINQLDISLDGEDYTITSAGDGEDRTYSYQEEELEIDDLQDALEDLEADSFTQEAPTQQEEISLTVHLDSENIPQVRIQLYRYDGTYCLAVVDGNPISLVPRTQAVALMEAVRAIVLN